MITNINENVETKFGYKGFLWKTILGIIIVFSIAIPRLLSGELFLSSVFMVDGPGGFVMVMLVTVVLGFLWYFIYKMLLKDKGPVLNLLLFLVATVLEGLFLANSLIVAVYWIGIFSEIQIDQQLIVEALYITTVATIVAVLAAAFAMNKLKVTNKTISFFKNFMLLTWMLSLGTFVLWIFSYILSALGMTGLLEMLLKAFYGQGPISILISFVAILFAEFLLISKLVVVKSMIGKSEKYLEYFGAMIVVNGIVRVYVEIFKLVLKLLARRKR